MNKKIKDTLRKLSFEYQDGFTLSMGLLALSKGDIFTKLQKEREIKLTNLVKEIPGAKSGFINSALFRLADQGWLEIKEMPENNDYVYSLTDKGKQSLKYLKKYIIIANYHKKYSLNFIKMLNGKSKKGLVELKMLREQIQNRWGLDKSIKYENETITLLNGAVITPFIMFLESEGFFKKNLFSKNNAAINEILMIFESLNFVHKKKFTRVGLEFTKKALNFSASPSYLPLFVRLENEMYSKQLLSRFDKEETHAFRDINVKLSGFINKKYFEEFYKKFINKIFDNENFNEQPQFLCEVGCGDGTMIELIWNLLLKTRRGKNLDKYPLTIIATDISPIAIKITKERLKKYANMLIKYMKADINNPRNLAKELKSIGFNPLKGIYLTAFLHHNRTYHKPDNNINYSKKKEIEGSFINPLSGDFINSLDIEEEYYNHIKKWIPYIKEFGMVVFELHFDSPKIISKFLGESHAPSSRFYHALSFQLPVSYSLHKRVFLRVGLHSDPELKILWPKSKKFIAISADYFK
jgi:DNA-binding PadR family transcriptional regulator